VLVDDRTEEGSAPGDAAAGTTPARPYWLVALVLLAVVAVVLGGTLLIGRQLRPPIGIEPAPTSVPQAQATAAVAAPNPQVTPTVAAPAALPTTTAPPAATQGPTQSPATAVATVATRSTASPLEREVAAAYLRYWDVRREAYLKMDPTLLPEVMAGAELTREIDYMAELRARGRGAKIDVEHNFTVVKATSDDAEVYDQYLNKSPLIDLATGREIPLSSPPVVRKISYELKKIDGKWKVVDGTQHE
jgi:hypothetical protein